MRRNVNLKNISIVLAILTLLFFGFIFLKWNDSKNTYYLTNAIVERDKNECNRILRSKLREECVMLLNKILSKEFIPLDMKKCDYKESDDCLAFRTLKNNTKIYCIDSKDSNWCLFNRDWLSDVNSCHLLGNRSVFERCIRSLEIKI